MSYLRLFLIALAAALLLPFPPGFGLEVRVASFNVRQGVGAPGSSEYNAVRDILVRVDADIVAMQELRTTDQANWVALANELGYTNSDYSAWTILAGGLYTGYYSRFPIVSTGSVVSPDGAEEITRPPFRAVFDVPGTAVPLVAWTVHHKASGGQDDEFRRAIEAMRCVQNINGYLATNSTHDALIVLGDFNDDVGQSQTASFNSIPSGMPQSYSLGADVAFPVAYRSFPEERYEPAGNGMTMLDAFHEDSASDNTFISSSGRLDYLFVSDALATAPAGAPETEVYNSAQDDGVGGLAKVGSPLASGTSSTASDHYLLFVDVQMTDEPVILGPLVVSPATLDLYAGEEGGPFTPTAQSLVIENTNAASVAWSLSGEPAWITPSSTTGLLASASTTAVMLAVNGAAAVEPPGLDTAVLEVTAAGLTDTVARVVELLVRDGVGDAWRLEHFGHIEPDGADFSLAGDDPDEDGRSNLHEYIADTEPTNALDFLEIDLASLDILQAVVAFESKSSRRYTLEVNDVDLTDPAQWRVVTDYATQPGSDGLTQYIDDGSGTGTAPGAAADRHYRLRVALP